MVEMSGKIYESNIVLTTGVDGVQGIMNVTVTFINNEETVRRICLCSIVCRDVNINYEPSVYFIL